MTERIELVPYKTARLIANFMYKGYQGDYNSVGLVMTRRPAIYCLTKYNFMFPFGPLNIQPLMTWSNWMQCLIVKARPFGKKTL